MSRSFGRFYLTVILAIASVSGAMPANALTLAEPTGRILLTVHGNIEAVNQGDAAVFDRELLQQFTSHQLVTVTPYTEGEQRFEGIWLGDFLDQLAPDAQSINLVAADGYEVEIPVSDAQNYNVMMALKQNGSTLRLRDRGPIWIVYPLSQNPELDTTEIRHRWIWQVQSIELR